LAAGRDGEAVVDLPAVCEAAVWAGFLFRAAGLLAAGPHPATTTAIPNTAQKNQRRCVDGLEEMPVWKVTLHPFCS
jgi:hypothetical protein